MATHGLVELRTYPRASVAKFPELGEIAEAAAARGFPMELVDLDAMSTAEIEALMSLGASALGKLGGGCGER